MFGFFCEWACLLLVNMRVTRGWQRWQYLIWRAKWWKKIPPASAVQWHWQRARWHKSVLQQIKKEHVIRLFDWLIVNSPSKHLKMVKNLSCGFRMTVWFYWCWRKAPLSALLCLFLCLRMFLCSRLCVCLFICYQPEKKESASFPQTIKTH